MGHLGLKRILNVNVWLKLRGINLIHEHEWLLEFDDQAVRLQSAQADLLGSLKIDLDVYLCVGQPSAGQVSDLDRA